MLGENISETYETELETLSAWMASPDTRAVILDPAARELLRAAVSDLGLSARAHDRILRVARTIADLDQPATAGSDDLIGPAHVSEAINYRLLDRSLWG